MKKLILLVFLNSLIDEIPEVREHILKRAEEIRNAENV